MPPPQSLAFHDKVFSAITFFSLKDPCVSRVFLKNLGPKVKGARFVLRGRISDSNKRTKK